MSIRFRIGAVAVAVAALTGCAGPQSDAEPPGTSATSSTTVDAATPATPSSSESGADVLPEAALLQPEDLSGAAIDRPAGDFDAYLRPPRPCGKGGPSDELRLAAARNHYFVEDPALAGRRIPSTRLFELVMVFRDNGAQTYLAELRAEAERCPRSADRDRAWTVTGSGDQLTLSADQLSLYGENSTGRQTVPVLVTRVDSAVVVLADLGYESAGGEPALLTNVLGRAVERVRAAT